MDVISQRIILKLTDADSELPQLVSSYKNFKGTIRHLDSKKYAVFRVAGKLSSTEFEITEMPFETDVHSCKTKVLDQLVKKNFINSYNKCHTDTSLRFVINLLKRKFKQALEKGFYNTFQLIHLIKEQYQSGHLTEFSLIDEIFDYHFSCHLKLYETCHKYTKELLQAEIEFIDNQVGFIEEEREGKFNLQGTDLESLNAQLVQKKITKAIQLNRIMKGFLAERVNVNKHFQL